jgi:hypothetical protein
LREHEHPVAPAGAVKERAGTNDRKGPKRVWRPHGLVTPTMFTMPCRLSKNTLPVPPIASSSIDMIVTGRHARKRVKISGRGNQPAFVMRMRGGKRGLSK